MPTAAAQRKAAAKKAAASRRANRAAAPTTTTATVPAAPATEPKGPRRRQLPDGKGPNDPVHFSDLIALGYVDAVDIQVADDDAG